MRPYFKDGNHVWRKNLRPLGPRKHVREIQAAVSAQRVADMRRQEIELTLQVKWDLEHAQMAVSQ